MIKLYLIIKNFYILDYQVITEVFFGTLTCLTPKKKNTYITHTISQVKMCCSQQFGHLQWNSCQFHTCQTSIQDKIWPLLPITIASLPATQNFKWDCTYIHVRLGYMSETALLKEINELKLNETLINKRNK